MSEEIRAIRNDISRISWFLCGCIIVTLLNFAMMLWYFQKQSEPDFNYISVSLTIFQIMFAIALVGGFWMFREAARNAAADEAKGVAREIAEQEALRIAEEKAREEARKTTLRWLKLTSNSRINLQDDNQQLHEMMNLLSDTETEDGRRT
ncbi:MAG: hypothetical protein VW474_00810 [Paracoccaceae bacterium]